jgi:hypothetical protein
MKKACIHATTALPGAVTEELPGRVCAILKRSEYWTQFSMMYVFL